MTCQSCADSMSRWWHKNRKILAAKRKRPAYRKRRNATARKWYRRNRRRLLPKARKRVLQWQKNNPEKHRAKSRRYYWRHRMALLNRAYLRFHAKNPDAKYHTRYRARASR